MAHWTWKTWQPPQTNDDLQHDRPLLSYLACDLLPQSHGFFTRHFHPRSPAELAAVLDDDATVYRVKQVHSGDVMTPDEIGKAIAAGLPTLPDGAIAPFPLADGVLSDASRQAVWACSADCTPALISDLRTGQVAAVHAGWRGTAQRILPTAVERFVSNGSARSDLRVALGPAIDGSVYQVGKKVAAEVGATVASDMTKEELLAHLLQMDNPPLLEDPRPDRLRLDVRRVNQLQLVQMGLAPEQVAIAPHCTYQEPETFFSYRRTHEKFVQWSGIVS